MGLESLKGSLDPVAYAVDVEKIPQTHYLGMEDEIVPPSMIASYISYFPNSALIKVVPFKDFGHQCCWVREWSTLSNAF
jgi:hypothetical protein